MFAFGEKLERKRTDFASERAKLKKGSNLGSQPPMEITLKTKECLVLPNITTTRLMQNCDTNCASSKVAKNALNGQKEGKPLQQIVKRGRLKDRTFTLGESGDYQLEDFGRLFVSKLDLQRERPDQPLQDRSIEDLTPWRVGKERKQRFCKTDSGFFEDPNALSPNESSDKLSNASNSSVTSPDHDTTALSGCSSGNSYSCQRKKKRRVTLDFKAILHQDKAVVRNTERLKTPSHMCLQSPRSLHADLMAFRSFVANNAANANFVQSPGVKLTEMQLTSDLKTCLHDAAVKQAVVKIRHQRSFAEPEFSSSEAHGGKDCLLDASSADCNKTCHPNLRPGRNCVDFPSFHSPDQKRICRTSSPGLTETALYEATRAQHAVDVNDKCQKWLNGWLTVNGSSKCRENPTETE